MKRLSNETFADYKVRRKKEQLETKRKLRGAVTFSYCRVCKCSHALGKHLAKPTPPKG